MNISKITLGTAQLGFSYGIANKIGHISEVEAKHILQKALEMGINSIDTASNYGTSEQIIGKVIKQHHEPITVTTKIPEISLTNNQKKIKSVENFMFDSIKNSSLKLKLEKIPICLIHNPDDINIFQTELRKGFQKLKTEKKIEQSGVSVYTIDQVKNFLDQDFLDVIQIPVNLFNSKILKTGLLDEIKKEKKIVFGRSIYLQGLFFLEPENLPNHFKPIKAKIEFLQNLSIELSKSIQEIAFTFVRDLSKIDSMVIGVETVNQLKENIKLLESPSLPEEIVNKIYREFNNISEEIVNPSSWKNDKNE